MREEYYWGDIANNTEMGRYITRKELGLLHLFFQDRKIKSCLDIGCGSGRFSLPLYDLGVNVIGLEKKLIPLYELQHKDAWIPIVLGDATCMPFQDSCLDCIIVIEVIDYFVNIEAFIQECHRILTEHGYLCFTFSNTNSWKRFLHRILSQYRTFYRVNFRYMKQALEKNGFQLEIISGFNWLPFGRISNNKLIKLLERLETLLQLRRLPHFSPWIFFGAKKRENS